MTHILLPDSCHGIYRKLRPSLAGTSSVINPWHYRQRVGAIRKAFEMSNEGKGSRWIYMDDIVHKRQRPLD